MATQNYFNEHKFVSKNIGRNDICHVMVRLPGPGFSLSPKGHTWCPLSIGTSSQRQFEVSWRLCIKPKLAEARTLCCSLFIFVSVFSLGWNSLRGGVPHLFLYLAQRLIFNKCLLKWMIQYPRTPIATGPTSCKGIWCRLKQTWVWILVLSLSKLLYLFKLISSVVNWE